MKKYILIIVLLFLSLFIKVDKYIEINNLKIIDSIYVCDSYYYLEEIIPIRDDNGINYDKKIHKVKNISDKYFIKYAKYKKCIKKEN